MVKGHKQTFLQRRYQIANKHRKRFPTSLIIREMEIKTTVKYFTSNRITTTKKVKEEEKNRK